MRPQVCDGPRGEPAQGVGARDVGLLTGLRRAAVVAAHVTALFVTLIFCLLGPPGTGLFSWHPVCMSIAFCVCVTEGVLVLCSDDSLLLCLKSKWSKVCVHWTSQLVVLLLATAGLVFVVASKTASLSPHLTSWHSVLGACTLAAAVLQAACGACVHFPDSLRVWWSAPRLKLYHATGGLLLHLLATATVVLATFSDWFQASVRGVAWWLFLPLPLLPALVVMNQITNAHLPRRRISS